MERGSIDQAITARSVVTLAPTLASFHYPGHPKLHSLSNRVAKTMATVRFNVMMLRWIESKAFVNSVAFEVWHVAPRSEFHDLLFEQLVFKLSDYAQRGVSSWEHYDEDQAAEILTASPHVDVIYDGDHDRVQRRWKFRGYRVPPGGTP